MDIWLAAVLVAWLPVAASLALLVGRSLRGADLRDRRLRRSARRTSTRRDRAIAVVGAVPAQRQERVSS